MRKCENHRHFVQEKECSLEFRIRELRIEYEYVVFFRKRKSVMKYLKARAGFAVDSIFVFVE